MARKLVVEVVGDTSNLQRSFRRGASEAQGFGRQIGQLRVGIGTLMKSVIVVEAVQKALEGLHATIHMGIEEVSERAKIQAQVDAALKSTGDVSHTTAKSIDEMALSLSNLSGIDDEVIKGGEAVLLSFTNIRNFQGRNNQIFDRATKIMTDFAAKSGRQMPAAAAVIGKALSDPAKAASSLRRAYVVLSESEKAAIAAAVAHGDTLKAQRLVLDDLQKRYGGQAVALGRTLPGMIQILRVRFKDLAGDLAQRVAPSVQRVVRSLTVFAKDPSWAHLGGVFRQVASEASRYLRAVASTWGRVLHSLATSVREGDFRAAGGRIGRGFLHAITAIFRDVRPLLSGVADLGKAIGQRLARVNWMAALRGAARGLSRAIVFIVNYAAAALRAVNWGRVGKTIVDGVAVAIGAVVVFLRNVNWGRVARAIWRLLRAAIIAQRELILGIGKELAKLLGQGILAGLEAMGVFLEKAAIKLELKIIEPFSHIPKKLGGGFFQDMKKALQQTLAGLEKPAREGGRKVGESVQKGIDDGRKTQQSKQPAPGGSRGGGGATGDGGGGGGTGGLPPAPRATGPTAAVRAQAFDTRIERLMTRAGYQSLQRQLVVLRQVSALISRRIAATKDIAAKANLEDKLLSVQAQMKSVRQQIVARFIDRLAFGVERARVTKTLADDLRALRREEAYLKAQVRTDKGNLDLQRQLLSVEEEKTAVEKQQVQQAREQRQAREQAQQYQALGLTKTGETPTAGVKALRAKLARVRRMVARGVREGWLRVTAGFRRALRRIQAVLSGKYGRPTQATRQKINETLDNIIQGLQEGRQSWLDSKKTDGGGGGDGGGSGDGGQEPGTTTYIPPPMAGQYTGAGATPRGLQPPGPVGHPYMPTGGPISMDRSMTINGGVHLHGVQDVPRLENELQKRSGQRAKARRGPM